MSDAKHTPGPWAWMDMGGIKLVGQHGHRPIVMDFVRKGMSGAAPRVLIDGIMREFASDHPDARLIAAAPDLLATLEEIERVDVNLPYGLLGQVRAAIAKAKGGAE